MQWAKGLPQDGVPELQGEALPRLPLGLAWGGQWVVEPLWELLFGEGWVEH